MAIEFLTFYKMDTIVKISKIAFQCVIPVNIHRRSVCAAFIYFSREKVCFHLMYRAESIRRSEDCHGTSDTTIEHDTQKLRRTLSELNQSDDIL